MHILVAEDIRDLSAQFNLPERQLTEFLLSVEGLRTLKASQLRDILRQVQVKLQRTILLSGTKLVLVQRLSGLLHERGSEKRHGMCGEEDADHDTCKRRRPSVSESSSGDVTVGGAAAGAHDSSVLRRFDTTRSPLYALLSVVAVVPYGHSDGGCHRAVVAIDTSLTTTHTTTENGTHTSPASPPADVRYHARLIARSTRRDTCQPTRDTFQTAEKASQSQPRWADGFRLFVKGQQVQCPADQATGRRKNRQRDAETECEWVTCESLDITEHLTRKPPNTTTKAPRPPESTASMCVYEQGCEEVDIEMYQPSHRRPIRFGYMIIERVKERTDRELYDRLQTQRERRDAETERKSCDVATHTNIQQTSDTGREETECILLSNTLRGQDKCAITFRSLVTPVRGHACAHTSSFELKAYLQMCSRMGLWQCPVCLLPCPYESLQVYRCEDNPLTCELSEDDTGYSRGNTVQLAPKSRVIVIIDD